MSEKFDAKAKPKELVSKYDISNLLESSNLDKKIQPLATKTGLKAE